MGNVAAAVVKDVLAEERRCGAIMNRTMKHMSHVQHSAVWEKWRDVMAFEDHCSAAMTRTLRMLTNVHCSSAWGTWLAVLADAERCGAIMNRTMKHMSHVQHSAVWEKWQDVIAFDEHCKAAEHDASVRTDAADVDVLAVFVAVLPFSSQFSVTINCELL